MKIAALAVTLMAAMPMPLAAQDSAAAEDRAAIVGTWRLVSMRSTNDRGERNDAVMGPAPNGVLTYLPGGRMMVLISSGGRKPLSTPDRVAAPAAERADAFATFLAYAGRYSIDGGNVIHHVEIASMPNWVNTDLVRERRLGRDRLILRTPPQRVAGTMTTTELVWERAR